MFANLRVHATVQHHATHALLEPPHPLYRQHHEHLLGRCLGTTFRMLCGTCTIRAACAILSRCRLLVARILCTAHERMQRSVGRQKPSSSSASSPARPTPPRRCGVTAFALHESTAAAHCAPRDLYLMARRVTKRRGPQGP
jgi:hypothetical protein